jgi:DNA mismatch repair ATPase MutS
MEQTNKSSLYEGREIRFSSELKKISEQIVTISIIRVAIAVAFFVVIYFSITTRPLIYTLPVLIILFAIFVKRHSKAYAEKIRLQNLVKINEQERAALKGDYDTLPTGSEFTDIHHPFAHDLDLFGEGSLFQYSNRSNTRDGKKKFAESLTSPLPDAKAILSQQTSIRELAPNVNFRQDIQAGGMEIQETAKDREQLREWLAHPAFVYGKRILPYLLIVIPTLTVASIALAFFYDLAQLFAILLVLVQWTMLGLYGKRVSAFHEYISRKKNILEKYAQLLHILSKESFQSPQLQRLAHDAKEADKEVKALASLVNSLDARLNFLTAAIVNSVLLYDLQCVYRLEKWKAVHASQLNLWLDTIAETEVLCSWGAFAFNNPDFSYATIHHDLKLSAKSLGHPLIMRAERITNDVFIGVDQRIQIITGANMAGKSTFLRSIGVNLILALAGAPVCASSFECSMIHLRTGMRAADSLKDHQSYFYAELNRLKSIMDELQKDKPLLVLLDEILKGTNSNDKLSGSLAMVKQLLPHPCLALIATHDLALGELAQKHPDAIKNFCFEANIEDDQLHFDYQLKSGLAQKMNATFLMKKMGIIPA